MSLTLAFRYMVEDGDVQRGEIADARTQALDGVPEDQRCQCEHVPVAGRPGVYEVPLKKEAKEEGSKHTEIGYE